MTELHRCLTCRRIHTGRCPVCLNEPDFPVEVPRPTPRCVVCRALYPEISLDIIGDVLCFPCFTWASALLENTSWPDTRR